MSSYYELLRDPRWQRRRLEIMNRDGFSCRNCYSETKTLNVHHQRYRKGAAPWEYGDLDLVTLCEDCHADYEAAKRELLDTIGLTPDVGLVRRVAAYAQAAIVKHSHGKGTELTIKGTPEWLAFSDIFGRKPIPRNDGERVYVTTFDEDQAEWESKRRQMALDSVGTDE